MNPTSLHTELCAHCIMTRRTIHATMQNLRSKRRLPSPSTAEHRSLSACAGQHGALATLELALHPAHHHARRHAAPAHAHHHGVDSSSRRSAWRSTWSTTATLHAGMRAWLLLHVQHAWVEVVERALLLAERERLRLGSGKRLGLWVAALWHLLGTLLSRLLCSLELGLLSCLGLRMGLRLSESELGRKVSEIVWGLLVWAGTGLRAGRVEVAVATRTRLRRCGRRPRLGKRETPRLAGRTSCA